MLGVGQRVERLLSLLQLTLESVVARRVGRIADQRQLAGLVAAGEDAVQRVVIFAENRVVFVIVTAGAADRQPQQPPRHHVDLIVDVVVFVRVFPPYRQEAHRRQIRRPLVTRQSIGRQLLGDEAIVRQVSVERPDHVVAVGVGIRKAAFAAERIPAGVGVTGHVQPVTAPALAIMGRGEQAIDQPGEGVGRCVTDEMVHFLRRWRQAEQIERGSANQCAASGPRRGRKLGVFQPGQHEAVERRLAPSGVFHVRRRRQSHRLKRPMGASGILQPLQVAKHLGRFDIRRRPGQPHLDPSGQRLDFRLRQRLVGRHLQVAHSTHGPNQQTLRRISRHSRCPAVSAGQQRPARIEPQIALLFLRPVTLQTTLSEQRADAVLEEFALGGFEFRLLGDGGTRHFKGERSEQ